MIATRYLASPARVHTPLIHFIGKRTLPKEPHVPQPHPAAPQELRTTFEEFRRRFKSYSAPAPRKNKNDDVMTYNAPWEAPKRFWRSRLVITDSEMDAVMSGGASR
ncbi:hypothetical protein RhiJN_00326 [Ceratobasidium sp. AG-Ba]|nr:hypothetical protein RhiJN_00326 [Ceratobasidium sp. AG-Ba]QRW01354.1 hypothetical protein RhiLY_00351 [Ceratobasidium sp. AG-Ba]